MAGFGMASRSPIDHQALVRQVHCHFAAAKGGVWNRLRQLRCASALGGRFTVSRAGFVRTIALMVVLPVFPVPFAMELGILFRQLIVVAVAGAVPAGLTCHRRAP